MCKGRSPPTLCERGRGTIVRDGSTSDSEGTVSRTMEGSFPVRLEPLERAHWGAVRRIYEEGLATGQATLETEVSGWEAWDRSHLAEGRLVAMVDGEVVGWAALSPVSSRCVYGGVAEVSVYVSARHRSRGVGLALLRGLIERSEAAGIWTLEAGIFPENAASLALHGKAGFREVGRRERLGSLRGKWRDVLLLERRSGTVGRD
jgi:L-amino acid N-acyltransferase YncA